MLEKGSKTLDSTQTHFSIADENPRAHVYSKMEQEVPSQDLIEETE